MMIANICPVTRAKIPARQHLQVKYEDGHKGSYYIRFIAENAGKMQMTGRPSDTFNLSTSQEIVVNALVYDADIWLVNCGDSDITVTGITICENYNATKRIFDELGITGFNGDTMPRA